VTSKDLVSNVRGEPKVIALVPVEETLNFVNKLRVSEGVCVPAHRGVGQRVGESRLKVHRPTDDNGRLRQCSGMTPESCQVR